MVTVRRRSRLPASLQAQLVKYFVGGATARSAALLTGVNRHTATLFFRKLREVIAQRLNEEAPELRGEVEIDESYFGGRRKGKRGRGAGGKVPVFGLLTRGGKVHTVIIPNVGSKTLFPIIRARIKPDAVVYSDSFQAYDVLDVSEFRHMRINHREQFADKGNHINGIENFWNQAKRHLRRYNGIPRAHFPLYLKECEWRFNYRPAKPLARNLKNLAQRNSIDPYLGQPLFYLNRP
jgi:transposase